MNAADLAKAGQIVGVQNFEQLIELGKDKNLDANEQHVVNIVDCHSNMRLSNVPVTFI